MPPDDTTGSLSPVPIPIPIPIAAAVPRLQAVDLGSAVVAPISFAVAPGHCLAVTGPSGAGKTRLLRLLADLDPGQGEVFLDGMPRGGFPAPEWRGKVLYQGAESAWWMPTVAAHFPDTVQKTAALLATRLGLAPDRLAADISQLSTGERQRATLIRSLLKKPAVLLLDEPTSALDADNVARVEALLLDQLRHGMSLLLVTHAQAQLDRLANGTLQVSKR